MRWATQETAVLTRRGHQLGRPGYAAMEEGRYYWIPPKAGYILLGETIAEATARLAEICRERP